MRTLGLAALVSVALVGAGCAGAHHTTYNLSPRPIVAPDFPKPGQLVGCVVLVGGPAHVPGCRGAGSEERGALVTVFNAQGRTVRHQRLHGQGFHFVLQPGRYRVGLGRNGRKERGGCSRRLTLVHAGRTTHHNLQIGCDWD